jgi:dipeptidyl aminopeptidase/acylaminoacyl peptidase
MSTRLRLLLVATAAVVLCAASAAFVLRAAPQGKAEFSAVRLDAPGRIVFRDTHPGPAQDHLVSVAAPGGARVVSSVSCLRFYAAHGTGICLQAGTGLTPRFDAVVLDAGLKEIRRLPLGGAPTRARVSPSGRMVAFTVFVSGDSYGGLNFSTRTGLLDTGTGTYVENLEKFDVLKMKKARDMNFWGVTFVDDDRFYATMSTGGKTYLVSGSFAAHRVQVLRENVECPSLSPDGTRLVFKKRIRPASTGEPWRLYLLDLKTMHESPLAETRSVDDQVDWLDSRTVAYGLSGDFGSDLWSVPADGTGTPQKIIDAAASPVVLS